MVGPQVDGLCQHLTDLFRVHSQVIQTLPELVKLGLFRSNEETPEFTPAIPVRALRRAHCIRDTVGGRVTHGTHSPPAWQYLTIAAPCCGALDSRPVVWPCLTSGAGSLVPRHQIFIAKAHG